MQKNIPILWTADENHSVCNYLGITLSISGFAGARNKEQDALNDIQCRIIRCEVKFEHETSCARDMEQDREETTACIHAFAIGVCRGTTLFALLNEA